MTQPTPAWVRDCLDWPTPHDCQMMDPEEAERLISRYVDAAIHAQILLDYQTANRDRYTDVARRIGAVHPEAANRVAARNRKDHR